MVSLRLRKGQGLESITGLWSRQAWAKTKIPFKKYLKSKKGLGALLEGPEFKC
jgi:hypothetical protein